VEHAKEPAPNEHVQKITMRAFRFFVGGVVGVVVAHVRK
jgi:hypothetical protein